MLNANAVFIVGAGASMPYKFMNGAQLLHEAKMLTKNGLDEVAGQIISTEQQEREILQALYDTQEESLDAMLETQLPHVQRVGKRFIAYRILRCERALLQKRGSIDNDWISHLFSRMAEGATTLESFLSGNKVTFITYNYDRVIEHKFMSGLRAKYGAKKTDWQYITARVIHLHGSVGVIDETTSGRVPFGANFRRNQEFSAEIGDVLPLAEETVKIVHEPKPDADEFRRAREVLSQAQVVFFLGFGFGRSNVDRLDLSCISRSANVRFTRYGMTDAEVGLYATQPFQKASLGNYSVCPKDWDCIALLRENINVLVARY